MEKEKILKTYQQFQQAMIDKDIDMLRSLTLKDTTFTHMSGKKQTREEFFLEIENGTLNYYQSTILDMKISIEDGYGHIVGTTRLDAKVYGMKGVWDLPVSQWYKEIDGKYYLVNRR